MFALAPTIKYTPKNLCSGSINVTIFINVIIKDEIKEERKIVDVPNLQYESMTVLELQQAILNKMAKNGNVTDYMKKTVYDNSHKESLLNWVKSFKE